MPPLPGSYDTQKPHFREKRLQDLAVLAAFWDRCSTIFMQYNYSLLAVLHIDVMNDHCSGAAIL